MPHTASHIANYSRNRFIIHHEINKFFFPRTRLTCAPSPEQMTVEFGQYLDDTKKNDDESDDSDDDEEEAANRA